MLPEDGYLNRVVDEAVATLGEDVHDSLKLQLCAVSAVFMNDAFITHFCEAFISFCRSADFDIISLVKTCIVHVHGLFGEVPVAARWARARGRVKAVEAACRAGITDTLIQQCFRNELNFISRACSIRLERPSFCLERNVIDCLGRGLIGSAIFAEHIERLALRGQLFFKGFNDGTEILATAFTSFETGAALLVNDFCLSAQQRVELVTDMRGATLPNYSFVNALKGFGGRAAYLHRLQCYVHCICEYHFAWGSHTTPYYPRIPSARIALE